MSKTVASFKTKYFEAGIYQGTEKFPGSLPPLSGQAKLVRDHIKFISKKRADYLRIYDRSLIELLEVMKSYEAKFNTHAFALKDLFTDYDAQEVLPSTCALSLWKSASTDLDNQGTLGLDNDVEYGPGVYKAVVEHYKRLLPKEDEELRLSMVRGKMIGYPFMIGGMNRALNDLFLAISASLVLGTQKGNKVDSLDELYNFLHAYHGAPFSMEGSRQQHTAKEMPLIIKEGLFSSTNVNPRYRIINMESKLSVMDVRPDIKKMLGAIKNSPFHAQDRAEISKRIAAAQAKGWFMISVDHSKFDFRHGGKRGLQQIKLHSEVLDSKRYLSSSTLAFKTRFFTYGHKNLWELPGDIILKSGLGNTTLIGCTGNLCGFLAALEHATGKDPAAILEGRGDWWDALMWGDDCVAMFKDASIWPRVEEGFKKYKLEVSAEPTIKFLGSNYAKGTFKGTMDEGYSVGRAFQQQFFPERPKVYPFTTIGYIARLDLMGPKGKDFHSAMRQYFPDLDLGESFDFADRHKHLESLIPEMQKQGQKISMIDDILQIFTHGMPDITDVDGDIPAVYLKLLGMEVNVDLTDPLEFLKREREKDSSVAGSVTPAMLKNVKSLMDGDMTRYRPLINELVATFKLNYSSGSVLY